MSVRFRVSFLFSLILAVAGSRSSMGATLELSAFGTGAFVTPEGAPLPAGSVLRVGTFINFGIAADPLATFTELWDAFRPLGEGVGTIVQPGAPSPDGTLMVNEPGPKSDPGTAFGTITGIATTGTPPDPVFVDGMTPLVIWAFDTTDPTMLGLAATNGRWGIFGASPAASGWVYSTNLLNNDMFLETTVLKVDMTTDNLIAYQGGRDPGMGGIQLAPEPSGVILMLMAALIAASGWRHRRLSH